jgi:hypothetical protein
MEYTNIGKRYPSSRSPDGSDRSTQSHAVMYLDATHIPLNRVSGGGIKGLKRMFIREPLFLTRLRSSIRTSRACRGRRDRDRKIVPVAITPTT